MDWLTKGMNNDWIAVFEAMLFNKSIEAIKNSNILMANNLIKYFFISSSFLLKRNTIDTLIPIRISIIFIIKLKLIGTTKKK